MFDVIPKILVIKALVLFNLVTEDIGWDLLVSKCLVIKYTLSGLHGIGPRSKFHAFEPILKSNFVQ